MIPKSERIQESTSEALLGTSELSGAEVAALSGIPVEQAGRLWQALGFASVASTQRLFTRKDADVLRFIARLFEEGRLDFEQLLQMARATGQSMARVASMHVLSVAGEITEATCAAHLTEEEIASVVAGLASTLVESHEPFIGYIWRRHLLAAISQTVASAGGRAGEGETGAVAFADLVDFTSISRTLADHELARIVDRFEHIAYQQIPDRGGRVIKMLGDEVMFSNFDSHAMAATALALAAACKADDLLPEARVGVALGPMLAWEGDLYGNTVNLASRLVGIAHPGTVLVSDELGRRLEADPAFTLRELRDVKLKGLGKTKSWVLRLRVPEEETPKARKKREKSEKVQA